MLAGCVAEVQPCLVMAVLAALRARQPDSHVPEGLQGVGRVRRADESHCDLEVLQGWHLVVSET